MLHNQRLLISVYDAQEAREAILGGARVIDCEDPAGALGDISPRNVRAIGDAVMAYQRGLDIQISTNIGESQMLFKRDDAGRAVQRFPGEIAGKAAQAALGVAAAMGTDIHPVNIVKVGLDGMPADVASEALREVVLTLDRSDQHSRSMVIAVFFTQDLAAWKERHTNKTVIRDLLFLREYVVDPAGDIDLQAMFGDDPAVMRALRDKLGGDRAVFDERGALIPGVKLRITELHPRRPLGFSDDPSEYLLQVADLTAGAGADGVMIDTRIHTKVARMVSVKEGTCDAPADPVSGLAIRGIHSYDQIADYARYCHFRGIEFWASGGIQPYQAQPLWALDGGVIDGMAVRSGASGPVRPWKIRTAAGAPPAPEVVNRGTNRVYRDLVEPYAPPRRGSRR